MKRPVISALTFSTKYSPSVNRHLAKRLDVCDVTISPRLNASPVCKHSRRVAAKPCFIKELAVNFQLLLPAFDATVDLESQSNQGLVGDGQQAPDLETDAVARSQSKQLSLWATAPEKSTDARAKTMKKETVPKKPKRTYKQEWHEYNLAQTNEKAHFQELLYELCQSVEEPIQTMGRPRLLFADILFCSVFKVYSGFATRRLISDLKEAQRKGYIMTVPHFNSIYNYFEMESLTAYLRDLIVQSSIPLKAVESEFAIDSSGFRTAGYVRWYNARYGKEQDNHDWIKLHLTCGVKTHIVTAVEISGRHAHDSPFFKPLLNATARNFTISEVSADKAYSSRGNLKLVEKHGGRPYIAFKDNARGDSKCKVWNRIYHSYMLNQEEYMEDYHKRSNVESVFSMIKRKHGESVRSKSKTGQINEAFCKILCHNLCVLIQSMYELGLELTFCDNSLSSQKVP